MTFSTIALEPRRTKTGTAYLTLKIATEMPVLLPLAQVQEVLILPAIRLTAMPNMPPAVLGLMNHRSRVHWLVDLAQILEGGQIQRDRREYPVVLVAAGNLSLGYAVQDIQGVSRFPTEAVQTLQGITGLAVQYLQGCIVSSEPASAEQLSAPLPIVEAGAIATDLLAQTNSMTFGKSANPF